MKYFMIVILISAILALHAVVSDKTEDPPPIFPEGARPCFAVKTVGAAQGIADVMTRVAQSPEVATYDVASTHHTMFENGVVVTRHDPVSRDAWNGKSALLVLCDNPRASAEETIRLLGNWGVKTRIIEHEDMIAVESDDFDGWMMVFQKRETLQNAPTRMLTK